MRNHYYVQIRKMGVYYRRCMSYIYVGRNGRLTLSVTSSNLSRIRTKHDDPVAEHFYTNDHNVTNFDVMGLEKLDGTDLYQKTLEQLWKSMLRTYWRYGVNTKE